MWVAQFGPLYPPDLNPNIRSRDQGVNRQVLVFIDESGKAPPERGIERLDHEKMARCFER